MDLYRYSVKYRRYGTADAAFRSGRTWRMTVTAKDPDDARRIAAIRDPDFGTTVETPRRLGAVVTVDACRFCKRTDPITLGTYQRVSFPDGVSNVCDDCFSRAYDEDTFATWRDTDVEVI